MMKVVLFFCCLVIVEGFSSTTIASSTEKGNRTEKEPEGGMSAHEKSLLTKVHGICFIFAWYFCVGTAFLGARYMRDYLPEMQPLGIRIWYHIHRTLNMTAVILMICGLVTILIAHEWRWLGPKAGGENNTSSVAIHSLFGLLSVIIAWIQPLNALIRCGPSDPRRPYFNWIHRILGLIGWLLAATTITIACKKFGKHFTDSDAAISVCAAFLAFCGASFIVAEFYKIRRGAKIGDLNGVEKSKTKKWNLHTIIVSIFGIVALVVSIILAVLIAGSK